MTKSVTVPHQSEKQIEMCHDNQSHPEISGVEALPHLKRLVLEWKVGDSHVDYPMWWALEGISLTELHSRVALLRHEGSMPNTRDGLINLPIQPASLWWIL